MQSTRFEQFDHTADVGIHAYGSTLAELFENAAFGMFSLVADLDTVTPGMDREIEIESNSLENLLLDWLRELLFLHETQDLIFTDFSVNEISTASLRATARGGALERARTETLREIKAVTYHGLKIQKHEKGWYATILFDI